MPAFAAGLLCLAAALLVNWLVRHFAARRRPAIASEAQAVLSGVSRRGSVTDTIAVQIEDLRKRCRSIDEQIIGKTIAFMWQEYKDAKESKDRVSALMSAVDLIEKLSQRLSPWYVRYEKAITGTVSGKP